MIKPSASLGNMPSRRQRFQAKGGLVAHRTTQSLMLEEVPEIQNQISSLIAPVDQISG